MLLRIFGHSTEKDAFSVPSFASFHDSILSGCRLFVELCTLGNLASRPERAGVTAMTGVVRGQCCNID